MDILTFISSLFSSLAWPVAILIIALIFRRQFSKILEGIRLKKIKRGDFELDFDQELSEIKSKVQELELSEPESKLKAISAESESTLLAADEQIELISQINPASAIALAWSNLERELQNTILRLAISADYPPYNSPLKNIQLLKEYKYIDKNTFQILNRLRILRNESVHTMYDSRITVKDVEEFNQLAKIVLEKLKSISRK